MKRIIGGIVIAAVALFVIEQMMGQETERRNFLYFDDMVQTVAYKTQSTNPHFEGGQTQQTTIDGTIPRGYIPLHYGNSEEELSRAGEELTNPFSVEPEMDSLRGKIVYQNYCQICHGAGGKGDGPVTKRGFPPPASLLAEQAIDRSDGQLFYMLTFGYKNMPSYASQVDVEDRWQAINYVRELQKGAIEASQTSPSPETEGEKQ